MLAAMSLLAAASAACGDDPPTTPTSTAPASTTETFVGTLPLRGSAFYSYPVQSPGGDVSITLASVTFANPRQGTETQLEIGVGIPSGEGCAVTQSTVTAPSLRPQLTPGQTGGTYCVRIADPGTLTQPANFGVRIVHP